MYCHYISFKIQHTGIQNTDGCMHHRYLDFISVMTYDFHGKWESFTGHNSPLFRGSKDTGDLIYFNTVRKYFDYMTRRKTL